MKNAEWLGWTGLLLIFGGIGVRLIIRFSLRDKSVWVRTSNLLMMIGSSMVLVCIYGLLTGVFSTE